MKTSLTGIEPIPVEYILGIAQSKATAAQRRPYIELIERWGDETGSPDEAQRLLMQLRDVQIIDPKKMPVDFQPRFRQPDIAVQLIEIIRKIDEVITSKQDLWTWAHVLRVMVDEGILYKPTNNHFDTIIRSIIPNKGVDSVRKNGDYVFIMKQKESWPFWPTQSYLDSELAAARSICNQIALEFAPILNRKIILEY